MVEFEKANSVGQELIISLLKSLLHVIGCYDHFSIISNTKLENLKIQINPKNPPPDNRLKRLSFFLKHSIFETELAAVEYKDIMGNSSDVLTFFILKFDEIRLREIIAKLTRAGDYLWGFYPVGIETIWDDFNEDTKSHITDCAHLNSCALLYPIDLPIQFPVMQLDFYESGAGTTELCDLSTIISMQQSLPADAQQKQFSNLNYLVRPCNTGVMTKMKCDLANAVTRKYKPEKNEAATPTAGVRASM